MAIVLDNTSKNVIMTYKASIFSLPVIVSGAGIEDWFAVDDAEGAVMEVGCDNTLAAHLKPAFVKGKITLQPLAASLVNAFVKVQQTQTEIAPILGTLTLTSATGLWITTYQNFIITSVFKGYELGEKVKDVVVSFSSQVPNTSILGDVLDLGIAGAGLVNNL